MRLCTTALLAHASLYGPRIFMCATPIPRTGGDRVRGDESIMAPKQHGSTESAVQADLRWGVEREIADNICSFNRAGAEPSLYFTQCLAFTKQLNWQRGDEKADKYGATSVEPIIFYDSVSGAPLFAAPIGRSIDDFLSECEYLGI